MADKLKFVIALLLVAAGIAGFYLLAEQAMVLRVLVVLLGVAAGASVAWFTEPGQRFVVLGRESVAEAKKVVWPTRKETMQTTGIVFAFVGGDGDHAVDHGQKPGMGALRPGPGLEEIMTKRWYVVHAYSGFEKSVQRAMTERIARAGMQDKFGQILVPVEEVVEMKGGQKHTSERKFFPGYVLVEMDMDDESWHLVKSTPKVTGFVGGTATKPTPISEKEVDKIMHQMQEGVEKPRPKVLFEAGEMVRVKEGPFTDFNGTVEEVNYEKSRLRVSVTIFGRATPVELEFAQVEKA